MFGFIKDLFNENSEYPRKITALPDYMSAKELNARCGRKVAAFEKENYYCKYYAKRVKDNQYDLYLHISAAKLNASRYAMVDQAELKLKTGVSLNKALVFLRARDRETVEKRGETSRPRNNVRRVEERLPPRH